MILSDDLINQVLEKAEFVGDLLVEGGLLKQPINAFWKERSTTS